MTERRSLWENALSCTRSWVLVGGLLALVLLAVALGLRPRASTAVVVGAGLAAGVVVHALNRLALSQPVLARRIDWESVPAPSKPLQSVISGALLAAAMLAAIVAVYVATGRSSTALIAFFAGTFLAYAFIALVQRILIERDFARYLAGEPRVL
jgi:hypothetical protein